LFSRQIHASGPFGSPAICSRPIQARSEVTVHTNTDRGRLLDAAATWRLLLQGREAIDARRVPVEIAPVPLDGEARALVDLFLSLALTSRDQGRVTAVLGQTLDGYIATRNGDSRYVNGEAGLVHLHRIRALSDAVLIGASTAVLDRPRLTTRAVEGPHATRVVIDPNGRLPASSPLLHDGAAPTLVLRAGNDTIREERVSEQGRLLYLPRSRGGDIAPGRIVAALRARGLTRLLVEGGGETVSRFLAAGQLDRLQLIVAPCLLGGGRPALRLPSAEQMGEALRPACRSHLLGGDVLFDFMLERAAVAE
jgi:diaminohydroxyphosphoribosylaminopyrimidine deaminase / 5-amino-6-(5-phosphoribosylamino)uracil reductase